MAMSINYNNSSASHKRVFRVSAFPYRTEKLFRVQENEDRVIMGTDRKKIEKQRVEASKAKNLFLSIVAHEIKGPLANTIAILELLKKELKNNTIQLDDCFEMINAEIKDAGRGIEIIQYLLAFFKLDENKLELEKKTDVNIRQKLMSLIDIFERNNDKQLCFKIIKDKNFPYSIKINPLIYQVFTILLRNAVKYSHQKGNIMIHLSQFTQDQRCYLNVVIADNGVGMNKEIMNRLFSPLFDTDEHFDALYSSPAIKLSYVKKVVEFLGGSLTIQSQGGGKGTQVSFTVLYENAPFLNEPVLKKEGNSDSNDAFLAGEKLAILIVEDNSVTSYLLKKELVSMGHDVTTAFDSFEAKAQAEQGNFDVIFMDISLPGTNGVELLRAISNPQSDKPIFIAVTSHDSEKNMDYFLDQGFVTVMSKPFRRAEILDCVTTVQKVLKDLG